MANEKPTANAGTRPSQAAYTALRRYEGVKMHHYNDPAGNCSYGVGTLAHHGACTPQERRQPVSVAQVNTTLATRVNGAAAAVRRAVPNHQLTQAQFDSLVSYTYNRGATGAAPVLRAANQGNNAAVVAIMNQNIYIHPHHGGYRLPPVIAPGLQARRTQESAPFRPQQQ